MGEQRGKCPVCRYRVRLRLDGYAQRHYLYLGETKYACPGGEEFRSPFDVPPVPLAGWFAATAATEEDADGA